MLSWGGYEDVMIVTMMGSEMDRLMDRRRMLMLTAIDDALSLQIPISHAVTARPCFKILSEEAEERTAMSRVGEDTPVAGRLVAGRNW